MLEQIKIILEAISHYRKELLAFLVFYVVIESVLYLWTKCAYDTTTVHSQSSISSETNLFHFRLKHPTITSNNTVYLKGFKTDGYKAILQHAFYGIYLYFKELNNIICLLITLGQIYYYQRYINFFVLIGFMIQYVYSYVMSKWDLLKQQNQINNNNIDKLTDYYGSFKSKNIKQKQLKRGDLIKLKPGDIPPADILLLTLNQSENKFLMVQELQLTGEDVVIQKTGLDVIFDKSRYKIIINHHKKNGIITDMKTGQKYHYTEKNMVFCGTKIIDRSMIGVVIETGNDCAIYRRDDSVRKAKTEIQKKTDEIIVFNFKILLLFAVIFSFVIIYKEMLSKKDFWDYFFIMLLLFNMLVPISLQFFFQKASTWLSKRISQKHNLKINSHGFYSFQIEPNEIVSDKTGTLTTNTLKLVNILHVNKTVYDDPDINILLNVLACTVIQPHSITGELLKNDVIEEKLLAHICDKLKMQLKQNDMNEHGAGEIRVGDLHVERLYYSNFDYKLEVKMGVIKYKNHMSLHIQGTPEAIDKYSHGKLKSLMNEFARPDNAYVRLIAHASKVIDEKELEILKNNPGLILNNMNNVSIYFFHDYIVNDVDKAVQKVLEKYNFTMLTGDKMSSAIEIGDLLGITKDYEVIESFEDIERADNKNFNCLIINGRLLETIINSERVYNLVSLMKKSKARIIYRAFPTTKQLFVAFLQKYMKKSVMMIGDGSNDLPAIMQADIGVGVIGENKNIQNISEIVIREWPEILHYIASSIEMKCIIANIIKWIITRSMITASIWLAMLMHSKFQKYKDPMNPVFTTLINAILFLCMMNYCENESIPAEFWYEKIHIKKILITGALIGFINGWVIFTLFNVNTAVSVLTIVQVLELIYMLYSMTHNKNKRMKINMIMILLLFGLLNVAIHWINKKALLKI